MLSTGLGAAPAFGGVGADQVALHVCQAAENGNHQPPGAGAGVGPRFGQGSELRLGVHDALDDFEQIEGAAGEAVNPRYRHSRIDPRVDSTDEEWKPAAVADSTPADNQPGSWPDTASVYPDSFGIAMATALRRPLVASGSGEEICPRCVYIWLVV
jgi:hypothetical protein